MAIILGFIGIAVWVIGSVGSALGGLGVIIGATSEAKKNKDKDKDKD